MLPTTTNRIRNRNRFGTALAPSLGEFMDEFFTRPFATSWSTWTPVADLYETDDEFVLEMELPGFTREDIEITVEQGVLTVGGQRPQREDEEDWTYHLRERSISRFSRSFALPRSVDADDVSARFAEGVLTVRLPKVAEAKPRRIEVKAN